MNGQLLDEKAVKELASLPSINELRSKIIGCIQARNRACWRYI